MNKVLIKTTCVRCHGWVRVPKARQTTLQTTYEDGVETEKQISYILCTECENKFGPIVRVWRRPEKADLAYFSKDRHDGFVLKEEAIPRSSKEE